jgi:hypothetical protein
VRDELSTRLSAIEPPLEETSAACEEGTAGVRRWGFGRLVCWIADGTAMLSWTDSRSHLLGTVQGTGPDLGELYSWWQEDARPLGRIAAEDASPSGPDAGSPLVRVPGAPDDVICRSLDQPIVDQHGRSWQIERVRFLGRPRYERVVFDLQRTSRTGRGVEVTIDHLPVTDVASEVPGSETPGSGRTALVVRMHGVTRAPDLQAYRPTDVDMVDELSLVRGAGSRTAILSLAGDGCYQVRIPVFGPSASGAEDRAEIFIDIPR